MNGEFLSHHLANKVLLLLSPASNHIILLKQSRIAQRHWPLIPAGMITDGRYLCYEAHAAPS